MPWKDNRHNKAYDFFRDAALNDTQFTWSDLEKATGWRKSSMTTYYSKQWKDIFEKVGDKFRVRKEFLRIKRKAFLEHVTQTRPIFTKYTRYRHDHVVTFEFLLPLSREEELRQALDELFFKDTLEQRVSEIGLNRLANIVPRRQDSSDEEFLAEILEVASKIGGYSISHVAGRYRADSLMTQAEAGELLASGDRYLIDETSAVVRFIIPCEATAGSFESDFESINDAVGDGAPVLVPPPGLAAELRQIRALFFHLFAEAIVPRIKGEDEIWLLEGGARSRLYIWRV